MSIVIVAHNEKPKIIQDTLLSLTTNITKGFIKEVLIVDDLSDHPVEIDSISYDEKVSC